MSGFEPPIDPVPRPLPPTGGLTRDTEIMNIAVLVLDDVGIEQLRPWSRDPTNTYAPTPTINRMCKNGVRFTRFYSMPVCSPTRASILTGRFPFHTGIGVLAVEDQMPLRTVETLLPRALQQGTGNRYRTAAFGKWHISTYINGDMNHPNDVGFEHFAGVMGNLQRGEDTYFSFKYVVNGKMRRCNVYEPTQTVNAALDWINKSPQPWFAWIAFNTVHEPIHRPPFELYDTTLYSLPNPEPNGIEDEIPYMKAMQQAADTEIGRFFASLDPTTLANTVFILLSDNGTSGGLSPDIGIPDGHNKGSCFEYGVNVPMVVTGPRVAAPGRVCSHLVSCVDIFATVLEIAGADLAQVTSAGDVDAVSFWPLVTKRQGRTARSPGGSANFAFVEQFVPNEINYSPGGGGTGTITPGTRAIIGDKYKIITRVPGLIGANSHIANQPGFPAGTAASNETDIMYDLYVDQLEAGGSLLAGGWPGPGPIPTPDGFLTQEEWDGYQALKTFFNNKTRDIP